MKLKHTSLFMATSYMLRRCKKIRTGINYGGRTPEFNTELLSSSVDAAGTY